MKISVHIILVTVCFLIFAGTMPLRGDWTICQMVPDVLDNSKRNPGSSGGAGSGVNDEARKLAETTSVTKVFFPVQGTMVEGVVVQPVGESGGRLPGIIFVHLPDESPSQQIDRMRILAGKGFFVLCAPWKSYMDIAGSLRYLRALGSVDNKKISLIGVHDGGTEVIKLACQEVRNLAAVVSIAGRPAYDGPTGDPGLLLFAPVLLIHGVADDQIPVSVSQYFFHYLQDNGKTPELYMMQNTRRYYNEAEWNLILLECTNFILRQLKGPVPASSPSQIIQ